MKDSDQLASARHTQCLQCGCIVHSRFCPDCGQRADVGPLRLGGVLSEAFVSVIDLELPILRTTKGLLRAPGRTAANWLDGQRKGYTNPVKYCVIIGILLTLLLRLRLTEGAAVELEGDGGGQATYSLGRFSEEYIAFLLMVLALPFAPIAGFLSRLFKVPRSAIDWYALLLYCLGISLLLQLLIGLFSVSAAGLASLLPLVFVLWGAWQFAGPEARWRSLATAILAIVFWIVLATALQEGLRLALAAL